MLIVNTAISLTPYCDAVIVSGEGIDLLVVGFSLAPENTYFLKAGEGNYLMLSTPISV